MELTIGKTYTHSFFNKPEKCVLIGLSLEEGKVYAHVAFSRCKMRKHSPVQYLLDGSLCNFSGTNVISVTRLSV